MEVESSSRAHQARTGPHIAVAVSCGLVLGKTRRAAAVQGTGKSNSMEGMRMVARRHWLNAEPCDAGSAGGRANAG